MPRLRELPPLGGGRKTPSVTAIGGATSLAEGGYALYKME